MAPSAILGLSKPLVSSPCLFGFLLVDPNFHVPKKHDYPTCWQSLLAPGQRTLLN